MKSQLRMQQIFQEYILLKENNNFLKNIYISTLKISYNSWMQSRIKF